MRGELEDAFDMDALDSYGLSEVIGPGVAGECVETKDGLHIWEDHFYPEIIDPATGAVLPDGAFGEIVFTSLTKEAMPVVRYRTGDLTRALAWHRALDAADGESLGPNGRHDDRARGQCVSNPDRGTDPCRLRSVAALSAHSEPGRPAGRSRGSGRGPSAVRSRRGCAPAGELEHAMKAHIGIIRESERAQARSDRAIARQGEARHRQEAQSMTSSTESAAGAIASRWPACSTTCGNGASPSRSRLAISKPTLATRAPSGAARQVSFAGCR